METLAELFDNAEDKAEVAILAALYRETLQRFVDSLGVPLNPLLEDLMNNCPVKK